MVDQTASPFPQPHAEKAMQDETHELRPAFNSDGLVAAIAQDADTGEVLMLAWMNADALATTLSTGVATYWSRSRQALWVKGETSGNTQAVRSVEVDCDQDAVLLKVTPAGGACHTGRRSCFYRVVDPTTRMLEHETSVGEGKAASTE